MAVVSSPCSKMVTRTDHSRSVPSPGLATASSSACAGGASVTFSTDPGPGEHRAGVPVLPAHDVRRSAVGAAGLEHLPGASGLVDQLARQDDPVSGSWPSWLLLTRVVTVPREYRGGGDGHGTHLRLSSSRGDGHPPPGGGCHPSGPAEAGDAGLVLRAGRRRPSGRRATPSAHRKRPTSMRRPDLTVLAIPAFVGAMAAEVLWQRRHPAPPGTTRAGDYELADTIASLTMGVGSLVAPFVSARLLDPVTPGRGPLREGADGHRRRRLGGHHRRRRRCAVAARAAASRMPAPCPPRTRAPRAPARMPCRTFATPRSVAGSPEPPPWPPSRRRP